jgi:hypothetical protein
MHVPFPLAYIQNHYHKMVWQPEPLKHNSDWKLNYWKHPMSKYLHMCF